MVASTSVGGILSSRSNSCGGGIGTTAPAGSALPTLLGVNTIRMGVPVAGQVSCTLRDGRTSGA